MQSSVILAGGLDVAEFAFWAFILFFIALVFYLRQEDRREGYPLENEATGRIEDPPGVLTDPAPKRYPLPFGRGTVILPRRDRDPLDLPARRTEPSLGAPFAPTGDPLADGIGPAGYANRARLPELDIEGKLRIQPLSADPDFFLAREDPDPRGYAYVGADGRVAGTVVDIWFDRSDRLIRYLGVELPGGRRVLAPMAMTVIDKGRRVAKTDSISAHQFAGIPALDDPGQVTRFEEERIVAYFGGGYLYAWPSRAEPLF